MTKGGAPVSKDLLYPGSLLGIHRKAAEKLLSSGNGDAALLYLAFLTGKDGAVLGWDRPRLDRAYTLLLEQGLADPKRPPAEPPPQKLEDSAPPAYSSQDVQTVMESDAAFAQLVPEAEKRLGRTLVTQDVKDLLYLTRYLGLAPEVVLLLVGHCVDPRKKGARVSFYQIKKEGLRWQQAGVATLEDADAYIARDSKRRDRHRTLLALLDRPGRDPVKQESAYLDDWIAMGFRDEVIREAYERTVFQIRELRWGYMNGILKSWHEQGLHTIEELRAAEQNRRRSFPAGNGRRESGIPASDAPAAPIDFGDLDWALAEMNKQKED